MLTFNVYSHARHDVIADAVTSYVSDLASALGSSVVARGQIRNLVARNWYDDGPVDLTGQLRFLGTASPFHRFLQTVAADQLVAVVEEALEGSPITPSIVCALAQTEALQMRPDLIVPLLPYIGDAAQLDPWSRIELTRIIRRAGDTAMALTLLGPLIGVVQDRNYDYPWIQVQVARELNELGLPHRALRIIRQSRQRSVRDWQDEPTERTIVAAQALRALHRMHQALDLYRIASMAGSDEATAQIAVLERQLGLSSDAAA